MEESSKMNDVLDIYRKKAEQYPNVGITIQAHLNRSNNDIQELIHYPGKIRVVKRSLSRIQGAFSFWTNWAGYHNYTWRRSSGKNHNPQTIKIKSILVDDNKYTIIWSKDETLKWRKTPSMVVTSIIYSLYWESDSLKEKWPLENWRLLIYSSLLQS